MRIKGYQEYLIDTLLSDMTKIPMEAGTACFTSSVPMGSEPSCSAETLAI